MGADFFVLGKEESADFAKAKAVCAGCDVQRECRAEAEGARGAWGGPVIGVWAGESTEQRNLRIRKRERRAVRRASTRTGTTIHSGQHGKRSTYVAGCRCDPCTDAEAIYSRSRVRA